MPLRVHLDYFIKRVLTFVLCQPLNKKQIISASEMVVTNIVAEAFLYK